MIIKVLMKVDEERVKGASSKQDLDEAIFSELGWCEDSGIETIEWHEVADDDIVVSTGIAKLNKDQLLELIVSYDSYVKSYDSSAMTIEQYWKERY